MSAQSGWCEGCWRTLDEIAAWGQLSNPARQTICAALAQRRITAPAQAPEEPAR